MSASPPLIHRRRTQCLSSRTASKEPRSCIWFWRHCRPDTSAAGSADEYRNSGNGELVKVLNELSVKSEYELLPLYLWGSLTTGERLFARRAKIDGGG